MNRSFRNKSIAVLLGSFVCLSSGCVVPGGGYGGGYDTNGGVSVGLDYYEPYGGYYGGWGSGYNVGPSRGHDRRPGHGGGGRQPPSHSYHGAGGSRSMPSIPSGARGGASHGRGH